MWLPISMIQKEESTARVKVAAIMSSATNLHHGRCLIFMLGAKVIIKISFETGSILIESLLLSYYASSASPPGIIGGGRSVCKVGQGVR